ncbi:MAG: hypothetical protein IPK50_03125 [Fibrobacterota bacterium]|nr:hypothetical protein [Fibrobacterota bacterium]QQS05890.1 MAG: hypothetical protein IPK50_03125 [Fibrobacterota bacterium]
MKSVVCLLFAPISAAFSAQSQWARLPPLPGRVSAVRSIPDGVTIGGICRYRGSADWVGCEEPLWTDDWPYMDNLKSREQAKGSSTTLAPDGSGNPRSAYILEDMGSNNPHSRCAAGAYDEMGITFSYFLCEDGSSKLFAVRDSVDSAGNPWLVWKRLPEFDSAIKLPSDNHLLPTPQKIGESIYLPISDIEMLQARQPGKSWRILPFATYEPILASGDTLLARSVDMRTIHLSTDAGEHWDRQALVDTQLTNIRFVDGLLWGNLLDPLRKTSELWKSSDKGGSWTRAARFGGSLGFDGARFVLASDSGTFEFSASDNSWHKLPDTIAAPPATGVKSFLNGFVVANRGGITRWSDGAWSRLSENHSTFAVFGGTILSLGDGKPKDSLGIIESFNGSGWDTLGVRSEKSSDTRILCDNKWGCLIGGSTEAMTSRDGLAWSRIPIPYGFSPFGFTDSGRVILDPYSGYMSNSPGYKLKLVDTTWVRTNEATRRSSMEISDSLLTWTDSTLHVGPARLFLADLPGRISYALWTPIGNVGGSGLDPQEATLVLVDENNHFWYRKGDRSTSTKPTLERTPNLKIVGSELRIHLDAPSRLRVESIDLRGRTETLLAEASRPAGELRIPLTPSTRSVQLIRAVVDGKSTTLAIAPSLMRR